MKIVFKLGDTVQVITKGKTSNEKLKQIVIEKLFRPIRSTKNNSNL